MVRYVLHVQLYQMTISRIDAHFYLRIVVLFSAMRFCRDDDAHHRTTPSYARITFLKRYVIRCKRRQSTHTLAYARFVNWTWCVNRFASGPTSTELRKFDEGESPLACTLYALLSYSDYYLCLNRAICTCVCVSALASGERLSRIEKVPMSVVSVWLPNDDTISYSRDRDGHSLPWQMHFICVLVWIFFSETFGRQRRWPNFIKY